MGLAKTTRSDVLPGFPLVSSEAAGQPLIAGPVVDQAALYGLVAKVRDLGLPLLSVQPISPGPEPEETR